MKPASRTHYYRIKRIVDMVREGSEAGYLPSRGHFRRELEVSPRTLARDLDFLRDDERGPIDYDAKAHLLAYHGNWYVMAHNPAKGRVETFALSRFRSIEGAGATFDRPQGFDDDLDFPRAHAGASGSLKPLHVTKSCLMSLFFIYQNVRIFKKPSYIIR